MLPAADDHAAHYAAARMTAVAGITATTSAKGHLPVSVSVSVGAATSRPGEPRESLLRRADHALLAAKRRTRSHHRPRNPPTAPNPGSAATRPIHATARLPPSARVTASQDSLLLSYLTPRSHRRRRERAHFARRANTTQEIVLKDPIARTMTAGVGRVKRKS